MLCPLVIAAVLLAGPPRAAESGRLISLPVVWTAQTRTFLESAPTIADVNGDGYDETLLAAREEIIALDGWGHEIWRRRTRGRYCTYPAALVQPAKPARIYAADGSGLMTCLNGQGTVVWQRDLKSAASWCAPVVADLRGDGRWSVIQGTERGDIVALDAQTGAPIWVSTVNAAVVSPAVADVDGDGKQELVVCTTAGIAWLLDSDGRPRWKREISGPSPTWATSAPIVCAASDGVVRIVVGANEGRVTCLRNDGATLWSHDTEGSVAASLSAGDIDGDGRTDVFAVTQTGVIYRFDEAGQERWRIDMQGRTIAAGALVDLDGDDATEYVVCTQSGRLMAFDPSGSLRSHRAFDHRTINMTPSFGRIAACGDSLGLIVSGGESGRVLCLRAPAHAQSAAAAPGWTAYRHDARKTGAWLDLRPPESRSPDSSPSTPSDVARDGIAPIDDDWRRVRSGAPIVFGVRAPAGTPLPLIASARCARPDGSLQAVLTPVLGATGRVPLSVDVNAAGVYRFQWSLSDAGGRLVSADGRDVMLEPMAAERGLVSRAIDRLRSSAKHVASSLPLSANALLREAADIGRRLEAAGLSRALIADAERAVALATAVEAAAGLGPGTSVVAFETRLWDSSGIERLVPPAAVSPLRISRRVVPGEHDPVSVKLFNVTDRAIEVRVTVDRADTAPRTTLLHSVSTPTSRGGMAWDALPRLDESGVLTIPSLACREIWLDVDFQRAAPGRSLVRLRAQALNGAGVLEGPAGPRDVQPPEATVEVQYTVLPFSMASAGDLRMCCWASYGPAEIKDLLAHGNNVFCVPQPEPRYDRQGRLAGFVTAKLDFMLNTLRGHDIVALVQGMPPLKARIGTPTYLAELKQYLDFLTRHLRHYGIGPKRFALYPIDEPGGTGWAAIHAYAQFGRLVRKVNPDVQLYVDGGAELPMLHEISPYVDIWCPGLSQLAEKTHEMEFIRSTRKELWSYDCGYRYTTAIRSSLKDTLIVPEYRVSALFAVRHGARGIGFWCYNIGPDLWARAENDYPIVYPGAAGPVTSRRWEAIREGVEDVRILLALRRLVGTTRDPAVKARITRLLDVSLPGLLDRSHQEVTMGLGRAAFETSISEAALLAFRAEMLDCLMAVSAPGLR